MAEKRIEKSDLIDPSIFVDIIKQAESLGVILKDTLLTFKKLNTSNPFKTPQDVKQFNDSISAINETTKSYEETQKQAAKATEQLNSALAKEVASSKEIGDLLDEINGTLEQNIILQTKRAQQIKLLGAEQKALNNEFKIGRISIGDYQKRTARLTKQITELKVANSKLGFTIKAQVKEGQAASTSFEQQAQRLGQLRTAYRKLNEEQRNNSDIGGVLLKSIKVLDEQVKKNDASIGNFQRNVGNYSNSIKQAAKETGILDSILNKIGITQGQLNVAQQGFVGAVGKSTGALKIFKVALASTGIGLLVIALGSVVTALTSSEEGMNKLNKALKAVGIVVGNVSDVFAALGDQIISFFSGDGFDTQPILDAMDDLINKTGEEIKQQNELSDIRAENLKLQRELTVETAKGEKEIAELRAKAKDVDKFTDQERQKFIEQAIAKEKELINLELELAERKNKIAQEELSFNRSGTEEKNAAAEAEAELFRIQTKRFNRLRELQSELNRVNKQAKIEIDEGIDDEDDVFDEELDAQIKTEVELLTEKRKLREKEERDVEESLARQQKAQDKANDEEFKKQLEQEERLKKIREERIQENIRMAKDAINIVSDSFNKVSEKRIQAIEEEEEEVEKNIDRQERRAEQGLDNTLAFEQQKAAELEKQREEEQKKQERRQKIQAYLTAFTEYLKQDPDSAAGKALAQVAIAEAISGFFYEGTEFIGDDNATKWRNTGKDDYLIAAHKGERIVDHVNNRKIGNISNDDLADLALSYRNGQLVSVGLDSAPITEGLQRVEKAVERSAQMINLDELGNFIDTRIENGLKQKVRYKRGRI